MSKLIYDLTIEDLVQASLFAAEHSPAARRSRFINLGGHASISIVIGIPVMLYIGLPLLAAVGVAGLAAAGSFLTNLYTWKPMAARTMRKMYREGKGATEPGEQTLELGENELRARSPKSESTFDLDSLTEIREDETRYYIVLYGTHLVPIPKTGASSGDADRFIAEVRQVRPELD